MGRTIDVQIMFDSRTKKISFTKLSDQKCLALINSDKMLDVWIDINNMDCENKIALAKYVGECHRKGITYDKLILNMAEECYNSMSDTEQLLLQKALELWANRNNKVFTWSLYETPIYFLAGKICFYIYDVSGFVEEVQGIANKIDSYRLEIQRLYAKDRAKAEAFNDYLRWIINN